MSGLDDSAWAANNNNNNQPTGNTHNGKTLPSYMSGLLGLLDVSSIMNDTRSTVEMAAIVEEINKRVESWKESTIGAAKKAIMPEVRTVDQTLSPRLSAFLLRTRVGSVVLAMPVFLFSRSTMQLDEESINTGNIGLGVGLGSHVLLSRTPVKQVRKENLTGIITREKEVEQPQGVTEVKLITAMVLDLDTIVDYSTLTQDGKEKVAADIVLREWENAIKIQIARTCVLTDTPLPSPFIGKDGKRDNAYGPSKLAIARTEGVSTVQYRNGIPSPANMKIHMRTNNRDQNNAANNNEVQRDIVTTLANVTLVSVPHAMFSPVMDPANVMSLMTGGNLSDTYYGGYRPFQPVVIMDAATAGVQMGSNDTLFSWLMGLWSMMTTNNRYIWGEGIRNLANTARGSLVDLDNRIDEIAAGCPNLMAVRTPENKLTASKMKDIDFVSTWIRRNVKPNAAFAVELSEMTQDAALTNLLMLMTAKDVTAEAKTVAIAHIDAMTNKAFSTILTANAASGKGWTAAKPILHRSNILVPQGTYVHNGQTRSLAEIDEMFLSNVFAKDKGSMIAYLTAMYGDGQTDEAVRRYRMSITLPNIVGGEVHITNFANRYFFDPEFTVAFAQAFDGLGDLQVSGTVGLYDSQIGIFAPGVDFASNACAGATGLGISNAGNVVGVNTMYHFSM